MLSVLFGTPKGDDASRSLVRAAAAGQTERIAELQERGGDLNFRDDTYVPILSDDVDGRDPDNQKTFAIIEALKNGHAKTALYLIENGADCTMEHDDRYAGRHGTYKPIDYVLGSGYRDGEFTASERNDLIKAMIENAQNPADLLSEKTTGIAVDYARHESIPVLAEMGAEFSDQGFVRAASPLHNPAGAVPTLEALYPYVDSVNVSDSYGRNAGHHAASQLNLDAFVWLEGKGLDKDAYANGVNTPGYAQCVATAWDRGLGTSHEEFAKHLVKNGYETIYDASSSINGWSHSPADRAIDEGNLNVALVFIDAGTPVTDDMIVSAIHKRRFNSHNTEQLISFLDQIDRRGQLSESAMQGAMDQIIKEASILNEYIPGPYNKRAVDIYSPVARYLIDKMPELADKLDPDNNIVHEALDCGIHSRPLPPHDEDESRADGGGAPPPPATPSFGNPGGPDNTL